MPENREIRTAPIGELRILDEADGPIVRGYAAVFNSLSEEMFGFRERVLPGAFTNTLKGKPDVRGLIDHDSAKILGRTTAGTLALTEDDRGLYARIDPPDTSFAKDVLVSIRRGDVNQMSFAFRTVTDQWHTEEGEEIRELVEVDLFDVSVVAFPAYPDTSVSVRSNDPTVALWSLAQHRKSLLQDRSRRRVVAEHRAYLDAMRGG